MLLAMTPSLAPTSGSPNEPVPPTALQGAQRNRLSSRQSGPNARSHEDWHAARRARRLLQPSMPPTVGSAASMALPVYMNMIPPLARGAALRGNASASRGLRANKPHKVVFVRYRGRRAAAR